MTPRFDRIDEELRRLELSTGRPAVTIAQARGIAGAPCVAKRTMHWSAWRPDLVIISYHPVN